MLGTEEATDTNVWKGTRNIRWGLVIPGIFKIFLVKIF